MGPKHTGELWVYIGTPLPNPSGNTGVMVCYRQRGSTDGPIACSIGAPCPLHSAKETQKFTSERWSLCSRLVPVPILGPFVCYEWSTYHVTLDVVGTRYYSRDIIKPFITCNKFFISSGSKYLRDILSIKNIYPVCYKIILVRSATDDARGIDCDSQVEQKVLLGFSMKFQVAARS